MGFLASILRALGPLALEHGTPMLRDWWKGRTQQKAKTDPFQQLAIELDQLRVHAEQVDSALSTLSGNLEKLNDGLTAREEKMRKALLTLFIWNTVLTLGLLALAGLVLHRG